MFLDFALLAIRRKEKSCTYCTFYTELKWQITLNFLTNSLLRTFTYYSFKQKNASFLTFLQQHHLHKVQRCASRVGK